MYRIDLLKEVFRKYRLVNRDTDKGHLNFTKQYAISYYINTNIAYELLDRYSTQISKYAYIEALKRVYVLINKREDFLEQIINYNVRNTNIVVIKDIVAYRESESVQIVTNDIDYKPITARPRLNLNELRQLLNIEEDKRLKVRYGYNYKIQR